MAGQLQETTSIADDQWLGVLEQLVKFGSQPESIGMDAEAVKNLAGILGGDLPAAANLVSRALQGNFAMFGRMGIEVGEAGTQAEKLNKLYEQLAERGAGQLEARAKTLNGQFRSLKNTASDLWEAVGNLVNRTGVLQTALMFLAQALNLVASIFPKYQEKLDSITNRVPPLKQGLDATAGAVKDTGEAMNPATASAANLADGGLGKLKSAAAGVKEELDKAYESMTKLQSQADQLDEAETAVRLAAIDEKEARGDLTPLDAKKARAAERTGLARRKLGRDKETIAAQSKRIADIESGMSSAAESALLKSGQTAAEREEALARARATGLKSDQEIQIEAIKEALAKTQGKGRRPIIQGEQRQILETNLKNLQDRVGAGQLTFTAAQDRAEAELEAARNALDVARRGPGRGRFTPEDRARQISEAQARLQGVQERVAALAPLPSLDKTLSDQRKAASDAATRYLDAQPELGARRRELEFRSRMQGLHQSESVIQSRTEDLQFQREAGAQQPGARSGARKVSAPIDVRPAASAVEQSSENVIEAINELAQVTKAGLAQIKAVTDRHSRDIAEIVREMDRVNTRSAGLRLR